MEKFFQALSALLPTGFAWPRDAGSTLMRVIRGIAASFSEHHDFTTEAVRQWQPATAVNRLAEWEEATGLPDKCFGYTQSLALRRQLLQMRLGGVVLPDTLTSPGAPGVIEGICQQLGYTVTVRYYYPFRCGRDRVGQRLGSLSGRLIVRIFIDGLVFRVGRNRVGQRLIVRSATVAELECYLRRIVPARFNLDFVYV